MAALQRTPGPWAIELWGEEFPSSATVYSAALGRGVGSIAYITPSGMRENTAIADASLIAAAPDLLAILKEARTHISDSAPIWHNRTAEMVAAIDAVIAKAEAAE